MNLLQRVSAGLFCTLMPLASFADFGLSTSSNYYTVDTGAGLVFKIRRVDHGSSTQSVGDIASLTYNGNEYQNQAKGSHINSGFDWLYANTASVSLNAQTIQDEFIKITVSAGDLTHYYMARKGYPHIYMATYFASEPNIHNHVRYILRLDSNLLPNGPEESDLRGTISTVEASDIFALPNGETRSKHYSNKRLKDWQYTGGTGSNLGMWVVRGNQEGGSGGPFYRSLMNQITDSNQEITYIVNYGEAQTEAFRTHILNDYTFVVTNGSAPKAVDTSWFEKMNLLGYAANASRGQVAAVGITGRHSDVDYTVGFANDTAQYWTDVDVNTGYFKSPMMRAGEYDMTVYKNELAVLKRTVTVNAGKTTILNTQVITDDPGDAQTIWRIGDWDGSPLEFHNGDKLTTMHPSDSRISSWDPGHFTVGTHDESRLPAYFWKGVNNHHTLSFKLNDSERSQSHTLRIGLTCAFAGGRPRIKVNDWQSRIYSPSSQPKTRTLTVGTYRCNNVTYTYDIPASAWKAKADDWNTLEMEVISGSGGEGFLSPGFSLDAIDLLANESTSNSVDNNADKDTSANEDKDSATSDTAEEDNSESSSTDSSGDTATSTDMGNNDSQDNHSQNNGASSGGAQGDNTQDNSDAHGNNGAGSTDAETEGGSGNTSNATETASVSIGAMPSLLLLSFFAVLFARRRSNRN